MTAGETRTLMRRNLLRLMGAAEIMSEARLSRESDIHRQTIHKLGEGTTVRTLRHLASTLGCHPFEFLRPGGKSHG